MGKMKQYKYLLTDFDGVIVDTEIPGSEVEISTLAEFGHHVNLDQLKQLATLDVQGFAREFEIDDDNVNALVQALTEAYNRADQHIRVIASSLDVLTQLEGRWAIVTNLKRDRLEQRLRSSNLPSTWLDNAITAEMGRSPKPSPDLYKIAIEKSGHLASDIIAIEDSPHGVHAAKSAGLFVLGLPTGLFSEDELESAGAMTIDSWVKVPTFLE